MGKEAGRQRLGRVAKAAWKTAAVILLVLLLLPSIGFGLLQTGWGQRQAIAFANDALAASGLALRVEGISGLVPFEMTIAHLRIDDARGAAIEADSLHVSLAAGDLLAGTVTLTDLEARRLALHRVPETPSAPDAATPTQPAWPSLPVDIAIDRLAVDRLELGAELAGEPVALTVDGRFALAENAGTATLAVERLDGRPARIVLQAAADPALETLSLDLVAEEPAGGVLPAMLGWDYDGPWRLAVQGDGPLADWQGSMLATAAGETLADLAITGTIDAEQPGLAIKGTVMPPAGLLPPQIAPEPVAVDLAGGLGDSAVTLAGTLSGRGLDLALDVAASLASPIAVEGSIGASAPDLGRVLAGLDLPVEGDVRLQISANGPLSALQASVSLSAERLQAYGWQSADVALAATMEGAPLDLAGTLALTLALRDPQGPDVDFDRYQVDAISLSAQVAAPAGGAVTLSDLAIDAGPTQLTGTISLDPEGGPIGFDVAVATDAGLVAAEAGLADVGGRLVADLAGAFDTTAELGWVETTVEGRDLAFADAAVAGLVGPSPRVDASGQIDADYGFQGLAADIALPGAAVSLEGDLPFGPVGQTAVPLTFAVSVGSLDALAGPLGFAPGELAGSLALSGTVTDLLSATPAAAVDITGEEVVVAGQSLGTVETGLTVTPTADGRIIAAVDAAVETDYGPARTILDASYDPQAGRITVQNVHVDASGAQATGSGLTVDLETLGLDGTIALSAARLSSLAGLIGVELGGSGSGQIALSSSDGRQDARIQLNVRSLSLPDTVDVDDLTADATVTDLLGDPRFSATATATSVATAAVRLENADLEASGSLASVDLSLSAVGESAYLEEPFPLAIDAGAAITPGAGGVTVRIASFAADFGEEQFALTQPVTIRSDGSTLAVEGLDATVLGGRIAGDVRLAPGASEVALDIADIALDRSAVLTGGIGASAKIDRLSVNLAGPGTSPSGTIALGISGVQLEGDSAAFGTLSRARLELTGEVQDGFLSLDARIGDVTAQPITLTLDNILRLSLSPFAAEADHGQPISGRLLAETELTDLNAIVAPSGDILLAGYADLDIAVGGVGGAPVLSGDGRISNASLEVIETGTLLLDLNAEIAGEGDRLTLRSLNARDRLGGSVSASGWADFGDAAVDIELRLNQLLAYDTDLAEASVSGVITLAGPLDGPGIAGDITVRPAEVRFAELGSSGYVEVDAIDVNGPGQLELEDTELTAPLILPLDIQVRIPNAFYIRGYGLESEWTGDLQVNGTTAAPTLVGTMRVLRGAMDLAGQEIDIGRGIVTFTGASPPDPLIDVEAVAVTDDISVSLIVSGPASATDFQLQSVPNLPQEEIMNRLLFGLGRGGASGTQAFQAGRALALITGREGDLGLVNTLRNITGITGLTVETAVDDSGLPAARVGGYVSEDVYLSVTRGTATGSGEAEISVEVLDGVEVRSSVTETGDSQVGVNFEWDY